MKVYVQLIDPERMQFLLKNHPVKGIPVYYCMEMKCYWPIPLDNVKMTENPTEVEVILPDKKPDPPKVGWVEKLAGMLSDCLRR